MRTSPFSRLPTGREAKDGLTGLRLRFGYNLECYADLLILRRSDGSFVAAFCAGNVDPFHGDGGLGRCRSVACGRC
jgi:hypothetical protein